MRVVDPASSPVVTDDHPSGVLAFRYLFNGDPASPENYMMQLAENVGRFEMITHRHNFDQFRYVVRGQMNLGRGRVIREGELCYFPEGTSYGPQDDPAGPLALVLQFGGGSGYGYMGPEEYRRGRAELQQQGEFKGAVYYRPRGDGRHDKELSINAIWRQVMGRRMLIPAPRYDDVIIMKPSAFRWMPWQGRRDVWRKKLGAFTERDVAVEMFRLEPGADLRLPAGAAIRLGFVLSGEGHGGGQPLGMHCGIECLPEETAQIEAGTRLELLLFTLPLLEHEGMPPQLASTEPLPGESVPADA